MATPTPTPRARLTVRRVVLLFAVILLLVPLTAAKCGMVPGPSANGMACRIEEYRSPSKARDNAGRVIVYATVANYCDDPSTVDHLTISVWLQQEHSDGHWFKVGNTETRRLGQARIPTTARAGAIQVSATCRPGFWRVMAEVTAWPANGGKPVQQSLPGGFRGYNIANCVVAS